MSEYQYVAFRAIDKPLSEENLKFMRRQSSRAKITRWSFANEYHYGDFRGDANEMLRRGYDIHLHYASFGIRKLLIRLPNGMPSGGGQYLINESLAYLKDTGSRAAILAIDPCYDAGELEEVWNIEEVFGRLIPLRAEILGGDLRPLYIAHLAVGRDINHDPDEFIEAEVPAGLAEATDAQLALAELFGIGPDLLAAAASEAPALSPAPEGQDDIKRWLGAQPASVKNGWLSALVADPSSSVRYDILQEFRKDQPAQDWPTAALNRALSQLDERAEGIERERENKAAASAARARANKLEKMADDPTPFLRKSEELVAKRTTAAYRQIGEILADLREALAKRQQSGLAEAQAEKLRAAHPKLSHLVSALRRQDFLPKTISRSRRTAR